ncbi:MAG: hypothetical protein AB7P76_02180 [Candidatus Melainabacteria bacterium]
MRPVNTGFYANLPGLTPAREPETTPGSTSPADGKTPDTKSAPKGRFDDMPKKLTPDQWKVILKRAAFGAANMAEYAKNCAMGDLQDKLKPVKVHQCSYYLWDD